jgi:hypothetical protein
MSDDVALVTFDEVVDRSVAKGLGDLLQSVGDILTEEEQRRFGRLQQRLLAVGITGASVRRQQSIMAAEIFLLQQEKDWHLLTDPQTGKRFSDGDWHVFREYLGAALGIAVSSIGNYLKVVRVAKEALGISPSDFDKAGGLITVPPWMRLCKGLDGRSTDDLGATIAPKTTNAEAELIHRFGPLREPGEDEDESFNPWREKLQALFWQDYAHDYDDAAALNKPPGELHEHSRQIEGRARVTWSWLENRKGELDGIAWHLVYPDMRDESGVTIMGDTDSGILLINSFTPPAVRDDLARRLRMEER